MPYIWHTTHFYIYPKKRKKHFPLNTFPWLTWTYCYLDYKVRWVAEFLGTDVKASYCFRFLVTKEVLFASWHLILVKMISLFYFFLLCNVLIKAYCLFYQLAQYLYWCSDKCEKHCPLSLTHLAAAKKGDYISLSVHQNKCFCSCFNNPF